MEASPARIHAPLGFAKPGDVSEDHERPGMLRARTLPLNSDPNEVFDYETCLLHDLAAASAPEPRLEETGFQMIDLSGNEQLQNALVAIRDDDQIADDTAQALRASLQAARLPLGKGSSLRVEYVADEGLIHRRAGPNGFDVNPGGMRGANGHRGAPAIHADQDVFGTPLKQLMNGKAPELFRHRTPDGRNEHSSFFLLNLWIPIQQITRPLVLMDRRSLDQQRHQLRYGLPVTRFLDRDESMRVNDLWHFLPDPNQKWHFRSTMGPDQGYIFDTLGEPHGSSILPGEDALEELYLTLDGACRAVAASDAVGLRELTSAPPPSLPEVTTGAIRKAWKNMMALRNEAKERPDEIFTMGEEWCARARAEMDAVVRKSIELRLAATLVAE